MDFDCQNSSYHLGLHADAILVTNDEWSVIGPHHVNSVV